jgi:pimeloyl-ACP methyl ester carboxylesterase
MLSYERHGAGEPLILVHGIGHRRQAWYPVLDHLVDHRDVILVDLPGHGDSAPWVMGGRHIQEFLLDMFEKLLSELGLEKAHIAGNSLGGRIALEAGANGHALSVTGLSPAGFWRTRAEWEYTHRLFRTVMAASRQMESKAHQLAHTKAGRTAMFGWINAHPTLMDPMHALGDFHNMRRAEHAMLQILPQASRFTSALPDDLPVTIAWGARDMVFPKYQAGVARKQLPNANHVSLPSCGHVPMGDAPELVAQVLLEGSSNAASTLATETTARRLPFRRRLAAAS